MGNKNPSSKKGRKSYSLISRHGFFGEEEAKLTLPLANFVKGKSNSRNFVKDLLILIFNQFNSIYFLGLIAPLVCQEWYIACLDDSLWIKFLETSESDEKSARKKVFELQQRRLRIMLPVCFRDKKYKALLGNKILVTVMGMTGVGNIASLLYSVLIYVQDRSLCFSCSNNFLFSKESQPCLVVSLLVALWVFIIFFILSLKN